MTPNNNWNIDTFEQLFKRFGGCWLSAFQLDSNRNIIMPEDFNDAFKFTNVEFRNAWELGLNDTAIVAMEPDDEPFIPEDKKDIAPVVEVMATIRKAKDMVKLF